MLSMKTVNDMKGGDGNRQNPGAVSFFGMIREDLHYNIGTLLLGLLVMVFNYPINLALQLSDLRTRMENAIALTSTEIAAADGPTSVFVAEKTRDYALRMTDAANRVLDGTGGLMAIIVPVAAVLCARCMFSYLMNRSTVDFYLSQPVSRTRRFFANYLSGILIMLICLMTGYVLTLPVAFSYGVSGINIAGSLVASAGYMLTFLILYASVILAVLICGRIFAAVAAVIVINSIGFSIYAIGMVYLNFFDTYLEYGSNALEKLYYTSPIYYLVRYCEILSGKSGVFGAEGLRFILGMAVLSVALTLFAALLHRIRPAEACGRTLAFGPTKLPLRIILSIIGGLLLSFLGCSQSGVFWVFFFGIAGVIIAHAIIEIVFNMDVRMLFSHRIETGLCALAAVGFICIFVFDPLGYDSYVPKASELSSTALDFSGYFDTRDAILRADHEYEYRVEKPEEIYTETYWDSDPFVMDRMAITEEKYVEAVLRLASCGAENASGYNLRYYSEHSQQDEETYYVDVAYRMSSGRVRYRRYELTDSQIRQYMPDIFLSMEYKEAMYPILELSEDEIGIFGLEYADAKEAEAKEEEGRISESIMTEPYASRDWESYGYVYDINDDEQFEKELLSALKADIRDMTFEDYETWYYTVDEGYNEETGRVETFSDSEHFRKGDLPGNYITKDILYYIPKSELELMELRYGQDAGYGFSYTYDYRDLYPLFDSYTNTKELLTEYGYLAEN